MVLKKKNIFLFEFGYWAESSARPIRPPHLRVACAAQPASTAALLFTSAHP
jgi:hypothetical protein